MCEVEKLVSHLIMTCYEKLLVLTAEYAMYGKGLRATTTFILRVRRGNIVMCIQKITKLHG